MPRPALIVTGASGFVGRHLLEDLKDEYRIFAIARRSQRECGAPVHPNIAWMQVDIGDIDGLARTFREIASAGGARVLLHLAAYYDYAGEHRPEYRRTNVEGTKNVLELARSLDLERFVFASSVAACEFPRREGPITEATPPDGRHIYAWSKREGERLVLEQQGAIPTCIVRFGAVYSDWCEYPPLYVFLNTWLGGSWRARILAGSGPERDPLHSHPRRRHVHQAPAAPPRASRAGRDPDRVDDGLHLAPPAVRARDPFVLRVGETGDPVPRPALRPRHGVDERPGTDLRGPMPFERLWMYHYIDRQMEVDNSHSRARLDWSPSARYQMERRLPFLIERFKSESVEWHARNAAVMRKDIVRPDLAILKALVTEENQILDARSSPGSARKRRRAACPRTGRWMTPSWSGWRGCCTGCC